MEERKNWKEVIKDYQFLIGAIILAIAIIYAANVLESALSSLEALWELSDLAALWNICN